MARAEFKARATLDNRQFKTGVAQMSQGVERFKSNQLRTLGGMIGGAFAAGAVINFGKEMLNTADAIDNTSKQLGVNAEQLQTLQRLTELTAGSSDKMTGALLRLAKAQAQAVGGEATPIRAFEQLGISMEEIQSMNPAELFEKIAKAVDGAGSVSKEASGASLILGRSYAELNTVINQVANEGLENLKNQMIDTNQIMSEESVKAADEMEESFNRSVRGMTNTLRGWAVTAIGKIQSVAGAAGSESASIRTPSQLAAAQGKFLFNPVGSIARLLGTAAGSGNRASMAAGGGADGGAGGGAGESITSKIARAAAPKASDQVAKIGGILGAQGMSSAERLARDQLDQQKIANDQLQRVAKASEATSKNTEPLAEG